MIPAIIGIESRVESAPDPAAGIKKKREGTKARVSKWLHLLSLLYLPQPVISLWLPIVRLLITSNLHTQGGKTAFSTLPENMVNVTAGVTGSYLVKAAMLNLGQSRVLPSRAIQTEHSTHAGGSGGTQGTRTAASDLTCCIGRSWFSGRDLGNVWKWTFPSFPPLWQICCPWENMRKCLESTNGKHVCSEGYLQRQAASFCSFIRHKRGKTRVNGENEVGLRNSLSSHQPS